MKKRQEFGGIQFILRGRDIYSPYIVTNPMLLSVETSPAINLKDGDFYHGANMLYL